MEGGAPVIALSRLAPLAAEALTEFEAAPAANARNRWELASHRAPITAELDGPWLVMSAPLAGALLPREMLERNTSLPGLLKLTPPADGEAQLRAEIPLDEDSGPIIRGTRRGFSAAIAALAGEEVPGEDSGALLCASQDAIKRLCDEAGWASAPRGVNACSVELECPGTFLQAMIAPLGEGVRASVELARCDEPAAQSVAAIVALMLRAGAAVRMARPSLSGSEDRVIPVFEVNFPAAPTAAQLAHALSALSVAARLCAEEVAALRDPDVAGEFLALSKNTTRKETTP